jgi:hypothetical protein
VRWFQQRGCRVTGFERDAAAVEPLRDIAEIVVADIENDPWPLPGRRFDAVVVTNYLWRPLLPTLVASVAAGGVLLYETFARGNEAFGRPSNPDFLLRPGELLDAAASSSSWPTNPGWPTRRRAWCSASPQPVHRAPRLRVFPWSPAARIPG